MNKWRIDRTLHHKDSIMQKFGRFGIILMITMILLYSMRMMQSTSEPSVFDIPKKLLPEKVNLQVWLYGRPDGAEVFSTTKSGGEDDRLYLEPATEYLNISPTYFERLKDSGYTLKISGSFYKGKGIPPRFLYIQPKPEKYSVFRYETLEIVKE